MRCQYATFDDYLIKLDLNTAELLVRHGQKLLAEKLTFWKDGKKLCFTDADTNWVQESNDLVANYWDGYQIQTLTLSVHSDGVTIKAPETLRLTGLAGMNSDARPMSTQPHNFFRSAYGPACTPLDDMLFEVSTDCGLILQGDCGKRFRLNREKNRYEIDAQLQGAVLLKFEQELYARKYKINYAPIRKNVTFSKPPVGWMTWYALMFDTTEQTVRENVQWLAENLNRYGVDTIWIDWEWYHDAGFDTFHPDTKRYPHGMHYVSDMIKQHGLVPSLWVAFSREWEVNSYMKENPEILLVVDDSYWCGKYYFDYSHPKYRNDFLPKALKQVDEWGFVGVKFDTLACGVRAHERFHERMYDPDMTTKDAFRAVCEKTREVLGQDRYILSCCASMDSDILWACDQFDAARVGADVFTWPEFVDNAVKRVARYYPMHNVVFYNDPDCLIVREEHSTYEQAKSRAAFISMLGLPVTLGDDVTKLPEERVEILRRSIPALDIHTMDLCRTAPEEVLVTSLAVDNGVHCYHLVSVLNTTNEDRTETIHLNGLGIALETPVAFEFYESALAEVNDHTLTITLKPNETKVFALRETAAHPQILSTSRHITQGVLEIQATHWQPEQRCLTLTADLVEKDLYTVTVLVPKAYRFAGQKGFDTVRQEGPLLRLSVTADKNESRDFAIFFD